MANGTINADAASTKKEMTEQARDLEQIDFGIKKSIRYHSRRRAFFERLDNLANWLVAVAGASAFAAVVGTNGGFLSKVLTAVITVIALGNVILGFGARARLHQDLYRKFSELAIEVAGIEKPPTTQDISRLRAKRLTLEADEPHTIDALERWCWNEEAESRGCKPANLQQLTRWQQFRVRFS